MYDFHSHREFAMLHTYFHSTDSRVSDEQHKRIIALTAALDFAKASASATTGNQRSDKVEDDLKYATRDIGALADAIQNYLDAK